MLEIFLFSGVFLGVVALVLNFAPHEKPELHETPLERRMREAKHSEKHGA